MPLPFATRLRTSWVRIESLENRRLLAGQLFPGQGVPVGVYPGAIVTADFNGDGKPDFATADQGGSVTIGINDGTGGFNAPTVIPVAGIGGAAPGDLVAGDFNGDGKIDLATANSDSTGSVSVLLGNGAGGFGAATNFAVGSTPDAIAAGDFNGDGKLDVATANDVSAGTVSVLYGTGSGSFGAAVTVSSIGSFPDAITTGDFNGDGRSDFAVGLSGATTNSIAVRLGTSGTSFTSAGTVSGGAYPVGLTVADFNGDAKKDLAVASDSGVTILTGAGNGTFTPAGVLNPVSSPAAVSSADFNKDGKADLAVVDRSRAGRIAVLPGNGAGGFGAATYVPSGSYPVAVASADFDGDGNPDLVAPGSGSPDLVVVLRGRGNGTFVSALIVSTDYPPADVVSGDLNADGKLDLVTANSGFGSGSGNTISVLLGNGDGTYAAPLNLTAGFAPAAVLIGDFNGDGKKDIGVANQDSGSVSVLLGNGNGTFAAAVNSPTGPHPVRLVAADFNADGKLDLATANSDSAAPASLLLGTGAGTFAAPVTLAAGQYASAVVAADFNKDGRPDLAVASYGGISLLLNNGAGNFTASALSAGSSIVSLATGDFNADGNVDLAAANSTSAGTVTVLPGSGVGTFAAPATVSVVSYPTALAVADFNADGKPDLAVAGYGGLSVSLGNGNGTFTGAGTFIVGNGPTSLAAADFNADGKTDVLTANGDGTITELLNQGAGATNPYVSVSGGVATVSGTTSPVTLSASGGVLTVTTSAGAVPVTLSTINGLVLSGVTATLTGDLGPATGNGTVAVTVAAGSSVTFASTEHLAALTVGGTLAQSGSGKLLRVTGLSLGAAGRLDLNANSLVYDYTGAAQSTQVSALIAGGRSNGTWTGPGLTSTTAKTNAAANTTLGYLEASDYKSIYGASATFAGESLDSTAVVVKYSLYGDTDLDGGVSINDFNRLATNFGTIGKAWINGDLDNDGGVSINDFNLLAANFGKTLPAAAATKAAPKHVIRAAAVPVKAAVAPAKPRR